MIDPSFVGLYLDAMSAVLAIDTSTDACSVALALSGETRACHRIIPRAHNQHIFSMVDEVLAGLRLSSVDQFVCGIGPGSFTGLRIAVSVLQGLAWSLDKSVVPVCSLEAQAQSVLQEQQWSSGWLLSSTDAQIGQVYWRLFRIDPAVPGGLVAVGEPAISRPDRVELPSEVANLRVLGSGAVLKDQFTQLANSQVSDWLPDVRPHASTMAEQVLAFPSLEKAVAPSELIPRYVQQDIGWKKLSEQPRRD